MTLSELPQPALHGRMITMDEYYAFAPEKFELIDGYLFGPADYPEPRRKLIALLLTNVGLTDVVRLAPAERWREALERVYGREGDNLHR